ncbi:MAG: YDG domain-containing protein, partial [Verrucomicrobiota bacterium]
MSSWLTIALGQGVGGVVATAYSFGDEFPPAVPPTGYMLGQSIVPRIDFDWGGGDVLGTGWWDQVLVKFEGTITVPIGGDVMIFGRSDDGMSMSVDGVELFRDWTLHGPTWTPGGVVSFDAGVPRSFEAWYFENGGGAVCELWWDYGGFWDRVPDWAFVPGGYASNVIAAFDGIGPTVFVPGVIVPVNVPTATSGLPVTLGVKSGPAVLLDGRVRLTGTGTVVLSANQAGDALREAAAEVTTTFESVALTGGGILREVFEGIQGSTTEDLVNHPLYLSGATSVSVMTGFLETTDRADAYGQRFRGTFIPPVGGDYTFWIASDDGSDLYVSTDDSPANRVRIAGVAAWTGFREWGWEGGQRSAPVTLSAGRAYYMEVLHKEGGGGDSLSVRWLRPDGLDEAPIPLDGFLPWGLKRTQTIAFELPQAMVTYGDQPMDLGATATSGNSVAYEVDDTRVAEVVAGQLVARGVGSVRVTARQGGSDGWEAAEPVTRTLLVTPRQLGVGVPTVALTKVYDGTRSVATTAGALSGVLSGDVVSVTASAAYATASVGTGKTVTVTYTLGGAGAGNYTAPGSQAFTTGVITAKGLTVSGLAAASRAYDGTTTATVSGTPVFSGVASGDTVTVLGTATGSFASKGVGTGKTVTVTGLSLGGASAGNYTLTAPTLTADITAKALTVGTPTVTLSKVYDGTLAAAVTAGSLSGVVSGDAVSVTASAAYDTASVGTGKTVTVTYTLGGTDAGNYTAPGSQAFTTGVITAKVLMELPGAPRLGSRVANVAMVADNDFAVFVGTESGPTRLAYQNPYQWGGQAGREVGVEFTGAETHLYIVALGGGGIEGIDGTLDGSDIKTLKPGVVERAMNGNGYLDVSGALAGYNLSRVEGGLYEVGLGDLQGALGGANWGAPPQAVPGWIWAFPSGSVWSFPSGNAVVFRVNLRDRLPSVAVAGEAVELRWVAGSSGSLPVQDYVVEYTTDPGLAWNVWADEYSSAMTARVTGLLPGVGYYVRVKAVSGVGAGPYSEVVGPVTLKRTQAITWVLPATDLGYGGELAALNGTATSGLPVGYTVEPAGVVEVISGRLVGVGVGVATVTATQAGNAMWQVAEPVSRTVRVLPKALAIGSLTLTPAKEYDGKPSAGVVAGALSGVVAGDDVTVSATGLYDTAGVGTAKTVTVTYTLGGADAGNYTAPGAQAFATGSITAKGLTVSGLAAASRTYDGTTVASVSGTPVLSGVVAGDTVTVVGTATGSFASRGVGAAKVVTVSGLSLGGASAGNYTLTAPTLTADITAKALTVGTPTVTLSKVYDGTLAAAVTAGSLSGVVSGDAVSVTASAAYDTASVGTGKTVTVTYAL